MFTFDDLVRLPDQIPDPPMPGTCCGICVTAADVGVGSSAGVAYPHPLCPEHGAALDHSYREASVHELHAGPMGVCECGAYRDEHESDG